jgi:hypothetical protein
LVTYGNANKYSPLKTSNASGSRGEYVTQAGGVPRAMAKKLAMTVAVKRMDSQRCVCRNHAFQFTVTSYFS